MTLFSKDTGDFSSLPKSHHISILINASGIVKLKISRIHDATSSESLDSSTALYSGNTFVWKYVIASVKQTDFTSALAKIYINKAD
jgi:hypothetical protein